MPLVVGAYLEEGVANQHCTCPPQTQQTLGLMQNAWNTHGTVNVTILRTTTQNIFIV